MAENYVKNLENKVFKLKNAYGVLLAYFKDVLDEIEIIEYNIESLKCTKQKINDLINSLDQISQD